MKGVEKKSKLNNNYKIQMLSPKNRASIFFGENKFGDRAESLENASTISKGL